MRKAGDQGDDFAQVRLGYMYAEGRGVKRDEAEAVKWYRKAAEQGIVLAQSKLGLMYAQGQGMIQDYVQAYMWAILAGERGDFKGSMVRELISKRMTLEQVDEAERLAREWKRSR